MLPPGRPGSCWERSCPNLVAVRIVPSKARAICHPFMLVGDKSTEFFRAPSFESTIEESDPSLLHVISTPHGSPLPDKGHDVRSVAPKYTSQQPLAAVDGHQPAH